MQRQTHSENYIKKIEYVFFHEKEIRAAVEEERSRRIFHEIKNPSALSDPTAAEAIQNLTPLASVIVEDKPLAYPEIWLETVHLSYDWSKQIPFCHDVAKSRYSNEYFVKTCCRLEIDQGLYYRLLNKFRNHAALTAAWHHLINV